MNRNMVRGNRRPSSGDAQARWTKLIGNDVAGIDDDIERLIGHYQAKYGYTRDTANAELVRRLSCLGGLAAAPLEVSCSS